MFLKKLIALFCLILFITTVVNPEVTHASKKIESTIVAKVINSEKYVKVKGGLILRDAPNARGEKVTILKDDSKVFVYSTDENGWSLVKQRGLKGYVKDSYLTTKSQISSTSSKSKKRVIDFSMNVSQVKEMEPAELKKEIKDKYAVLEYEVEKFGYTSLLRYYFVDDKLAYIGYDFLHRRVNYSWDEMSEIFDKLDEKAIQEFEEGILESVKDKSLSRKWKKDKYSIILSVNNYESYTKAQLIFKK
ncbi:SH3 domain-containing protein [Solibacillus sp. FSL K6-4121]|uniref:SH3 domain-containing protein n=1 Tax=Solibacillus sp. FSL K6-4121 TaxID=2921505 RepID=UPI0030FA80D9